MRLLLPAVLLSLTVLAPACSDDPAESSDGGEGLSQLEETCRDAAAAVDPGWGLDPDLARTQGEDTCAVVSPDGADVALTMTLVAGRDDVDAALEQACGLFFQAEPTGDRCEKPRPPGGPVARTGRAFVVGDTVVAVSLYAEGLERQEGIPDQLDRVEDALTS